MSEIKYTYEKEGVLYNFADTTEQSWIHDWLVRSFPYWEPNTFKSFRQAVNPQKIAIDIGAWIGLTAVWLSKHFQHVVCVDADKKSVVSLEKNLQASYCTNYSIINNAVYETRTQLTFGANNHLPHAALNDSTSQLKAVASKPDDYIVSTITLADIFKRYEPSSVGFIKMDIEGGEEHVLSQLFTQCKAYKIPFLISFHVDWWQDKDVTRFKSLFEGCNVQTDALECVTDAVAYLQNHPFGSLFVSF
jgi:FkbM family methyltransferase